MRTLLGFTLLLCLAVPAAAGDLFVSNIAGDDRRDARAARLIAAGHGPVRSIGKALRLAAAGDRIIVENTSEPYRETLSMMGSRHGASSVGPLVIEGRGAVLDGSVGIPEQQWENHAGEVFSYRPARLGHQQLFIAGRPAVRRPARSSDVALPAIEPLEWCFMRGKIYFRVERGRLPADYELSCCGLQTGITLYQVEGLLIRDLIVQGFQLDGVAVHDLVRETRLERVTSRGNGKSGISVRGASLVELDDCQLSFNGQSQLRVDDFARCWLYRCELPDDTAPAIQRSGGQVTRVDEPFAVGGLPRREERRSP
ncbi:MAG: right-handed parallel beta-helix repeat-containing protein [Pirellulales bacterium]